MLKNNYLILLIVFLLILILTGCKDGQALPIPDNFKIEGSIITWTDVKNAAKYRIEIENPDTGDILKRIVASGDDLNNYNITPGNYQIRLQAVGTDKKWLDSAFTEALSYRQTDLTAVKVISGPALVDNLYVKWMGRTNYNSAAAVNMIYHSTSGFEVHFVGTEVKATLSATNYHIDYKRPYIVIVLDDDYDNAKTLALTQAETEVVLAEGLTANGEHKVTVYKRSESIDSHIGVKRLETDGAFQSKVEYRERMIEFIAASSSTGFGNLGTANEGKTTANSDALQAYAFLTARALNADLSIYAASGWGVKFSYWTNPHHLNLYDAYKKVDMFSDINWNFSNYFPDVIVMNLGTNDWSYVQAADEPNEKNRRMAEFKTQYINFIKFVRGIYPDAEIIILYGLMNETNIFDATVEIYNEAAKTVDQLNLFYINGDGKGCSSHPSAVSHQAIAAALTNKIKEIIDW